jgi:preprotein translocase subunit SecA
MRQPSELAQWNPLLRRVKELGPDMASRTDAELRGLREVLSKRLAGHQDPEPAMAEAFSAVLEVARRTAGPSYSESDVIAGAALYSGQAVQTEDNGYNHFVALLPSYFCAVQNESVHYITTCAALAQRGYEDAGGLCAALGLRARLLPGNQVSREEPGPAADSDLTYGSYQKMAIEYLGEHLAPGDLGATSAKQRLAIVDQIDRILIDQANLPLVIRAPKASNSDYSRKLAAAATALKRGKHYHIDQATGAVTLSAEGLSQGAALLRAGTLEGLQAAVPKRHLEDALRARDWYRRGKDYQVSGARIVVSANSRLGGSPRLREGILQAIEAKEGLTTSPEEAVWARITVSGFFRTYARLCGLSGVAARPGQEMAQIYGLTTAVVPAEPLSGRVDHPGLGFEKARSRLAALAEDAARRHRTGQPVVIGALTPADSTLISRLLAERKIPHRTLLPGDEEAASAIMSEAGQAGSVTILTTEVARGQDVPLGHPAGSGLAVLAAGRSRSWRADQSLRGLAGRRGDPGESQFFVSMEDQLLRGLQSRLWSAVPERVRQWADATPLSDIQARIIDDIQRDAEQADAQRRRDWLAVEEVEGAQRAQIYSLIDKLVQENDISAFVGTVIDEVAAVYVRRYRDPDRLLSALAMLYSTRLTMDDLTAQAGDPGAERAERIRADAHIAYGRHEQLLGPAAMRRTERRITFSVLTRSWSQHLAALAAMRAAAGLDDGSLDGLAEYQHEAAKRYAAMREKVKEDIVGYLFHSEPDTR